MEEVELFNMHRPKPNVRENALRNGLEFPSDEELLMLILNGGCRGMPLEKLAERSLEVINESCGHDLVERLRQIPGMGEAKALSVAAAVELGRRRFAFSKCRIQQPSDVVPYVKHYSLEHKEHFVVASINGARELMSIRLVSMGSVSRTLVHPREVFAEAVSEHAAGVICCHNHPFGPCLPSNADRATTRVLAESAVILGMSLMDHIIITQDEYYSFLEHGLIKPSKSFGELFTADGQEDSFPAQA